MNIHVIYGFFHIQGGKDEFEKVTAIEGAKKLGDLAFNCNWPAMKSKTGTNIGPPFDIKLAPCNGLLTIATSWNKQKRGQTGGTDYSTAAIAFWADTDAMANMEVDGPIGGIVTGTNGAWPKPESVKDYTWSMVRLYIRSQHSHAIQLNINDISITISTYLYRRAPSWSSPSTTRRMAGTRRHKNKRRLSRGLYIPVRVRALLVVNVLCPVCVILKLHAKRRRIWNCQIRVSEP